MKKMKIKREQERLNNLMKELEKKLLLMDEVVTTMKNECANCLMEEFDLLKDYMDVVDAIARNTNQLFRFTVGEKSVATHVKLVALAWYYACEEYVGPDLVSYEGFVECLRTDVYANLFRRVDNYYGILEPKMRRK